MFKKKLFIFALAFILVAFQFACGQVKTVENSNRTLKTDARIENAKKQADEMYTALNKTGDFNKLADLAHPKLIEISGGREKYIEIMKTVYKSSSEYFEFLSWTIEKPQNLTELNNQLFVVVPRTLEGVSFQKTKTIQKGFAVGVSSDDGKTWKFVNGVNFDKLFPSLADKFQVPKQKTFINGIEQ